MRLRASSACTSVCVFAALASVVFDRVLNPSVSFLCYNFFEFVVSFVGGFCVCAFVDALRTQRRVAGERRRCQCGDIGVTVISTYFILIDFTSYGTGAADVAGAGCSVAVNSLGSSPRVPWFEPRYGKLF